MEGVSETFADGDEGRCVEVICVTEGEVCGGDECGEWVVVSNSDLGVVDGD